MTVDHKSQILYVNITTEEHEKLESIEFAVATLCQTENPSMFIPIWIGVDADETRSIRLTASGHKRFTVFEIAASEIIQLTPSELYLLIADRMQRR